RSPKQVERTFVARVLPNHAICAGFGVLVGLGACGCTHKESQCNNRAARSQRTNILVHKSCCRGSDESRNVPSCRFWKFLSWLLGQSVGLGAYPFWRIQVARETTYPARRWRAAPC